MLLNEIKAMCRLIAYKNKQLEISKLSRLEYFTEV